jgi:hypothetical protein
MHAAFCAYVLALLYFTVARLLAQKMRVECWWNWPPGLRMKTWAFDTVPWLLPCLVPLHCDCTQASINKWTKHTLHLVTWSNWNLWLKFILFSFYRNIGSLSCSSDEGLTVNFFEFSIRIKEIKSNDKKDVLSVPQKGRKKRLSAWITNKFNLALNLRIFIWL